VAGTQLVPLPLRVLSLAESGQDTLYVIATYVIRNTFAIGGLKLEKLGCIREYEVLLLTQGGIALEQFGSKMVDAVAPSTNAFNWRLDKLRQTRVGFFVD